MSVHYIFYCIHFIHKDVHCRARAGLTEAGSGFDFRRAVTRAKAAADAALRSPIDLTKDSPFPTSKLLTCASACMQADMLLDKCFTDKA